MNLSVIRTFLISSFLITIFVQASQVITKPLEQLSAPLIKTDLEFTVVFHHNGKSDLQFANTLVENQQKISSFLQKRCNGLATYQDFVEITKIMKLDLSKEEIETFTVDSQFYISCKNICLTAKHVDKNSTYIAFKAEDLVSLNLINEFFAFIWEMYAAKLMAEAMSPNSAHTKSNDIFSIKRFKLDIQPIEKEATTK